MISQSTLLFSILSFYQAIYGDKTKKVYFILFIFLSIFIILSGTKRSILGLPIFVMAITFMNNRKTFYKYILPNVLFLGLFWYLLTNIELLYSIVGERLEGMFYSLGILQEAKFDIGDNSTNIRKKLFSEAIKMIPETPIFGRGFGYFETHTSALNTKVQTFHTHNNYLELIISYGVFGFVFYYSLFVNTTLRLIRRKNKTSLTYMFLSFFIVLYFIIEPSSVTFYVLPIYYIFLYFAYWYSWTQDPLTDFGRSHSY